MATTTAKRARPTECKKSLHGVNWILMHHLC
jgi:hypothetical protein